MATAPDARVLGGRCLPYGECRHILAAGRDRKAHAGILENDPAAVGGRSSRAASVRRWATRRCWTAVSRTIGIEATPARGARDGLDVRRALGEAWTRYLGGWAGAAGLVVIEDIHWASPPLLDLIEHLSDGLADGEVMIVCPSRPELLDMRPSWGGGKRNATAMTLSPLRAEDPTS